MDGVYGSGATADAKTPKWHPWAIFQRSWGEETHKELSISALKLCEHLFQQSPGVEKADTRRKFTTAWPWLMRLWQRVWRASTRFSLNHLPSGHLALTKACCGCYKLSPYHTPALTDWQLHPSGLAWPRRWLGRNRIQIL